MKDVSYYQLRAFLYPRENHLSAECKLEELERIWFCTKKNVKRKLKKLEGEGKLIYQPGKGRGNPSFLTFSNPFQKEVEEAAKEYNKRDQLEELIHLLQLPIPKSWIVHVSNEVQELLGLQSSTESKDVLRTILTRDLSTLDPLYTSTGFESYLIQQLGDTLLVYNEEMDSIQPHLAHHWVTDESSTKWTLYLRKGVRFHHQRSLTSEDVKYTFERFKPGATPLYWLVKDIAHIECLSEYIIQFQLHQPNPFFLRYISSVNLVILPKDLAFDEEQWIGTGPFQIKERTEKKLVLEAFDQYFLERPLLDEVQFWRMPRETAYTNTFEIQGKESEDASLLKQEVVSGFRYLAFNFGKKSIVQHHDFRKAIYHLLDMKKMYKALGRDTLIEASSYFPWKSQILPKNGACIKGLLESSGYLGETLTLYAFDIKEEIEEVEWFVHEASLEGIHIQYVSFTKQQYYLSNIDQEADLVLMGEVSTFDYHLSFLGAFYNEALFFRRFLASQHLERIEFWLEECKQEVTKEKREKWIEEVENYIREEHLFIFLNHPIKHRIFQPMIQDIHSGSFGHVDLRKLWIK